MSWLLADKILRLVVAVMVGVWVARYLGPENFGVLNFAVALTGVVGVIASLGLNGIVVRDLVREPNTASTTMASAFVLQLLGGTASAVLLAGLAMWYGVDHPELGCIILILGLTFVFKSSDVGKYWLEATVQARYGVWVENGALLMGAVVRGGLIIAGAGVIGFAWASLLEAAIVALGLLLTLRLLRAIPSLTAATQSRARAMLKDAWPLLMASVAVTLYMRVDMLMLGHLAGGNTVGIYAAATRLSEVFYLVPTIIVTSVCPSIIRSHHQDRALYELRMRRLYCLLAWLAAGFTVPVAILSDPLIATIFGKEYAAAGKVLSIHMFGSIAVFLGVASSQHLLVEGKQMLSMGRTMIGLVCNVLLNLLLIPRMGATGAALATVISYFVATFSLLLFKSTRSHALSMALAPFFFAPRARQS